MGGHTSTADTNRLTTFEYNGLDQVTGTTVNVHSPNGQAGQTTTYTYGGSGMLGNDVLRQVTYPGGTTETYTRNNLGEVLTKAERNGVVHTYIYDGLGRMQSDSVSIPSGVADDLVDSRVFAYDVLGNLTLATAKDGGSVFNQVKREYNGLGQLVKEWQAHDGVVATSGGSPSPVVQYNYSLNSAANYSRLTSIVYPNGYIVGYQYIGVDSQISRPTLVTAAGVTVESEGYLGLGFVLNRTRPAAGIADLTQELDIHGRVEDTFWKEGASTRDDLYYLYDRVGNLTDRGITGQSSLLDERAYNDLYHMEQYKRGGGTPVNYTLDSQGNRYPDGRTYTVDNQISFTGFVSDSAGNSTQVRTAAGEKFKTKYDAWGNLVTAEVRNASTDALLRGSTYYYDALGRRIHNFGYVITSSQEPFEIRDLYYDTRGHVIQEDKTAGLGGTVQAVKARYVWSPDGQLILRDYNVNDDGTLEQRIYVQTDAQGNVISLIDGSGNVLERYTYGPFGTVEVRNANWSGYTPSAAWKPTERYNWVYLYEGMRLDPLAVVYHGDSGSDYDPIEGRSMQPDLSAFGKGTNGYAPNASTSMWSYLPGELWNTVSGAGKEIAYRAVDVGNNLLYLQSNGFLGSSNLNLSTMSQLQASGETTWARATFSSVPLVGSGYNAIAGEDLLTGQALTGLDRAGAWAGFAADLAFMGAGGLKLAGYNPALKLPRLRGDALHDLTALRSRVDVYAQRALDYAVRKAVQKGWTLAENSKVGKLVDRYTRLVAKRLDAQLALAGSPYRVPAQFARTARGRNIPNGARPRGSGIVDLAITDAQYSQVFSIWDTTVSWRWNTAATNAKYLRLFNPQEGFVREINPSIRRF